MPYTEQVRGAVGINYQAAPLAPRLAADPDPANVFLSATRGHPPTPLVEARAGDPVRLHVLAPSSEQAQVFAVDGHEARSHPIPRTRRRPCKHHAASGIRPTVTMTERGPVLATIVFAWPILPRKLDSWRKTVAGLARSEDFSAARRRQAVKRERIWLQQTPEGPLEIVVLETNDPAKTFQSIASSQEPFDVWFRQFVLEHAGVDLSQPAPPGSLPEQVLDWSADE